MKKFLKLLVSASMLFTLAACGGNGGADTPEAPETVTLKVWASQEDQTVTQEMIDAYIEAQKETYPGYHISSSIRS